MAETTSTIGRPKWHRIYYVLAAFDVFAICVSLYVNHRIMTIYVASIAADRTWVGVGNDVLQLGEWAAATDSPGNEVFQSKDVAAESEKLEAAYREFKQRFARLHGRLSNQPQSERIRSMLEDLQAVRTSTAQVVRDAKLTFMYFDARQLEKASEHMAAMDRWYATVGSALVRLRSRIESLQNEQLDAQTAAASMLQKSEYLIAGLITLMIAGATGYGLLMARQVSLATRLEDRYRDELELRVDQRTADLLAANQVRAELLRLLISAQEDERKRIARDLHDGVGQTLTYLVVALRRLVETAGTADQARIGQLGAITAQTLEEVRRLARGLRPSVLDDLGLQPAIERLAEELSETQGIHIGFDFIGTDDARLSGEIETAIYRIVQESLTNTVRHSGASEASVRIELRPGAVTVRISDNGRGFDTTAYLPGASAARSVGLSSIRERTALLGGAALIESNRGQGTSIQITLPISTAPRLAAVDSAAISPS